MQISLWNTRRLFIGLLENILKVKCISPEDIIIDCGTEKTIELAEPVWDDLPPTSLISSSTGSTSPTITQFPGRTARARIFDNNDLASVQSEVSHDCIEGEDVEIHIHWFNNGSDPVNPKYVNFQVAVSVAPPMEEMLPEVVYTTGNLEIAAGTALKHYVTTLPVKIPGSGIKIGDYLLGEFKRISPTGGAASPSSHPFVVAVGFHAKRNTLGSRQMYIK
jgi:hypothetical protein